jgi:hypothetical protein
VERLVCLGRIAVRRIYGRVLRVTLQRGRRFFLLVNLFLTMSCPTPSDFQNLVVDPNSAACDQLRKLGLLAEMVADAYECIYNEDGSLSQTFIDKLCATGCGEGTTSTTTTSGGGTGTQEYTSAGTYEFTVPGGVTLMTMTAVGGGGGGGGRGSPYGASCGAGTGGRVASGGGSGQRRSGTFAVTPGEVLIIGVGSGGGTDPTTGAGYSGAASGVTQGGSNILVAGAGGGGASGCCSSGTFAGGAGGSGGSGGTATNGNAGGSTGAYPTCGNGSGGASVGLSAGAGASGNPLLESPTPGSPGAVLLSW